MGYPWGSLFANSSAGWPWAFFVESLLMLPVATLCFFLPFTWRPERAPIEEEEEEAEAEEEEELVQGASPAEDVKREREHAAAADARVRAAARHMSIREEFFAVAKRPIYLLNVFGYAANTAVMIGISTFGSALFLEFGCVWFVLCRLDDQVDLDLSSRLLLRVLLTRASPSTIHPSMCMYSYFKHESSASTVFGAALSLAGMLGTPIGGALIDRATRRYAHSEEGKLAAILRQNVWFAAAGMLLACVSTFIYDRTMFIICFVLGAVSVCLPLPPSLGRLPSRSKPS